MAKETQTKIDSEIIEDQQYEGLDDLRSEINGRIEEAKKYFETNYHINWDEFSNLYRGLRARGKNMLDWQNNFSSSKPFAIVHQLYATIMSGLYPKEKLWSLSPRDTSNPKNDITSKVWKEVMLVQAKKMHLRRNLGWSVLDMITADYGIMEYGWKFENISKKYLDYKTGKLVELNDVEKISIPYVESVSPFDFLSDLDAMSWEGQQWVARRVAMTWSEIENDPTYNMQDEITRLKNDTKELIPSTLFKGWKYVTKDTVVIILDSGHIIKKHWTLLKSNEINFLPLVLFPEQRTPGGIGLFQSTRGSMEYIDKIMNSNADNLDLALQRIWTLKSSSDISFSKLTTYPGKVFKVDTHDELAPVPMPPLNSDAYKEIEMHDQFIKDVAGNMTDYSAPTAEQDKLNALQTTIKSRETIVYNQNEFVIPLLRAWLDMNQQFMDIDEVSKIVGNKAKDLEFEKEGTDLNIDLEVDLTGESSEVERITEVDNLSQFTNLATAIAQLPPNIQQVMWTEAAKLFGYENDLKQATTTTQNPQADPKVESIKQEAIQMAQKEGTTPEQLMNALAQKFNMQPQDFLNACIKAGGIQAFISQGGAK